MGRPTKKGTQKLETKPNTIEYARLHALGRTVPEIAETVGKSESAVRAALHRFYNAQKKERGDEYFEQWINKKNFEYQLAYKKLVETDNAAFMGHMIAISGDMAKAMGFYAADRIAQQRIELERAQFMLLSTVIAAAISESSLNKKQQKELQASIANRLAIEAEVVVDDQ